jgi:AraC-like DNA-binding protein
VREGRIVPKRDAETLGFVASNSFLRFFKRTMNESLREWRRGRAAA